MSGSMTSLYVGTSGLKTSQNALNTTAHNLANIDTTGYTRQQVLIQDNKYQTLSTNVVSVNQVGSGASIQLIRTVRDQFYDKQYRVENGRQGFYDVQYAAVSEIETVLGETEGEAFQNSLEDLWTSFSELASDSSNITNRTAAVNTSKVFLERAQQIEKQMTAYQESLNIQIKNQVTKVNAIGAQIAELNKEIRTIEAGGIQRANDLRDSRNLLLDQLSGMVSITYKEFPNGTVNVNVEGVNFITPDGYMEMGVETVNEFSSLLKPIWPAIEQDVYPTLNTGAESQSSDIGSLKGILVSRGDYAADYTALPVAPKKETYESEADYQKALSSYEKEVADYNKKIDSSSIMSFQAKFDQLIHGVVTAINDILSPNTTMEVELNGVKQTITVLDEENAPIGIGEGNQIAGTELFTRTGMSRYEAVEVTVLDEEGNPLLDEDGQPVKKTVYQYNEEDPSNKASLYTIGQITINQDVLENVKLLPLNQNQATGDYDASVVEKIKDMWNTEFASLDPNSLTKYTFKEYYTALVGDVATRGKTYEVISENQNSMVTAIQNSRSSVMGVSSEEELSNLIKYQHAYNASSRYINTVSEMLESVITSFLR